jgi:hypothetical protein
MILSRLAEEGDFLEAETASVWDILKKPNVRGYITQIDLDNLSRNLVENVGSDNAQQIVSQLRRLVWIYSANYDYYDVILTDKPQKFVGVSTSVLSPSQFVERYRLEELLESVEAEPELPEPSVEAEPSEPSQDGLPNASWLIVQTLLLISVLVQLFDSEPPANEVVNQQFDVLQSRQPSRFFASKLRQVARAIGGESRVNAEELPPAQLGHNPPNSPEPDGEEPPNLLPESDGNEPNIQRKRTGRDRNPEILFKDEDNLPNLTRLVVQVLPDFGRDRKSPPLVQPEVNPQLILQIDPEQLKAYLTENLPVVQPETEAVSETTETPVTEKEVVVIEAEQPPQVEEPEVNNDSGGQQQFIVQLGDETQTIENFGGIGRGSNPSQAIIDELDTLKFIGAGLSAKNLRLTQVGDDLAIRFEGNPTEVILTNFQLENLDNLASLGNILFDGDERIYDRFDVFNAEQDSTQVWQKNTVTFLNERDNITSGFDRSDDIINGQGGDDKLRGLGGDDILRGGMGDDTLIGGSGNDTLVGEAGDDWLQGGAGENILKGGEGSDVFVLTTGEGFATIMDFTPNLDFLDLAEGLSLEALNIVQGTGDRANDTAIRLRESDEILAWLVGTDANSLSIAHFGVA